MDTLTHALSGALVGRATQIGAQRDTLTPRSRAWIGALAAAFPDTDFVLRFIDPMVYLDLHRGVTHSFLLLPLWAWLLALLISKTMRGRYSVRALAPLCAIGIGAHIVGDVFTAFGTQIFSPFSNLRVSIPTTFIIDPFYSAILIAGLLATWRWPRPRTAVAGLCMLATYVAMQGVLRSQALSIAERYVRFAGLSGVVVDALPQPLSPAHWKLIVVDGERYHEAHVGLWHEQVKPEPEDAGFFTTVLASYRSPDQLKWSQISRFGPPGETRELARQVWERPELSRFRRFARFPLLYRIDRADDSLCAWFTDLRFSMAGRTPPFRYGLCSDREGGKWRLHRLLRGTRGDREVLGD